MTGFIVSAAEMATQCRVEAEMIEGVVGCKKRGGQIVVALGHKDMQERILRHRAAQRLRNVDVAIFIRRITPRPHASCKHFVGQVTVEFYIVPDIIVQHARIWTDDRRYAGVELWPFARGIAVNSGEARVDAAHGAALAAQQLLREALDFDAQVGAIDVVGGKPGEARELLLDFTASRRRQGVAGHERVRVFANGKLARFFNSLLHITALQIGRKFLVIPRDRGVRRQIEDVRQIIARVEFRRFEIQDSGNQDDAIEIHAVALLEIARKASSARGAVTFASKEFWRRPALVTRGIEPDEIRHGFNVWRYAMKLLRRLTRDGAAVARRNGIDEHKVADVEK